METERVGSIAEEGGPLIRHDSFTSFLGRWANPGVILLIGGWEQLYHCEISAG